MLISCNIEFQCICLLKLFENVTSIWNRDSKFWIASEISILWNWLLYFQLAGMLFASVFTCMFVYSKNIKCCGSVNENLKYEFIFFKILWCKTYCSIACIKGKGSASSLLNPWEKKCYYISKRQTSIAIEKFKLFSFNHVEFQGWLVILPWLICWYLIIVLLIFLDYDGKKGIIRISSPKQTHDYTE